MQETSWKETSRQASFKKHEHSPETPPAAPAEDARLLQRLHRLTLLKVAATEQRGQQEALDAIRRSALPGVKVQVVREETA